MFKVELKNPKNISFFHKRYFHCFYSSATRTSKNIIFIEYLMARPRRFERPTSPSGGVRSIQLSYGRMTITKVF